MLEIIFLKSQLAVLKETMGASSNNKAIYTSVAMNVVLLIKK